ncbi:MAG: GAF domain-containing protein [Chloroflexi bacterium]|nr:GAF domain-containing protein [Chloroflexota bacterium]
MGMEIDDRRDRLNLAESQYEASSTIYGSSDPVEILNALVNFGGKAFAKAYLGLLDPETQILNIIATRDAEGLHATQETRRLNEYPAYETLSAVEVLSIPDVSADPFLTVQERAMVQGRGYGSMLVIPLVVAQRLIGLIEFNDPKPVEISTHRLRAMRNLGDQIAVVFENQALLRSTASTLDEVQALYDINRAMLGALDPRDMLRVLRDFLAQDATVIFHASVERDPETKAESVILRHVSRALAEEVVELPLPGTSRSEEVFETAGNANVLFVESAESAAPYTPLDEMLKAEKTRSSVIVIVREHGLIQDYIAVAFGKRQSFDSRTRRLYNAVADQIGIVLQNQRLLRDAQRSASQLTQQVRILQVLNRLSIGLSSFQTEQELLDYTAESLVNALGVDHIGIALFRTSDDQGTVVSEYPNSGALNSRVETRNSVMLSALREAPNRPYIVPNVATSDVLELETRATLKRVGVAALMVIALRVAGELIGSVGFDFYDLKRQFTPDMIETAQTMVAQVAIGMQNIRLLTDTERRADQLQRVATFGQAVQATLSLETILDIMLGESRAMIPLDRMSIALFDARQGKLRVVGQYEDGTSAVDIENGSLISMSGTFVGQVWETQEMLAVADTHNISNVSRAQDLTMRSVMVAPIRSRGRMIGTVSIGCFAPYSYTETDQAIYQQMINQLAVAIENAAAYTQSQRVAKNEALINDIATHFQEHSDIQDMLQIAVDELGRALGARRARIRLSMDGK